MQKWKAAMIKELLFIFVGLILGIYYMLIGLIFCLPKASPGIGEIYKLTSGGSYAAIGLLYIFASYMFSQRKKYGYGFYVTVFLIGLVQIPVIIFMHMIVTPGRPLKFYTHHLDFMIILYVPFAIHYLSSMFLRSGWRKEEQFKQNA